MIATISRTTDRRFSKFHKRVSHSYPLLEMSLQQSFLHLQIKHFCFFFLWCKISILLEFKIQAVDRIRMHDNKKINCTYRQILCSLFKWFGISTIIPLSFWLLCIWWHFSSTLSPKTTFHPNLMILKTRI